jgi:prepilin-type N-terminal cleavage/methylation domain-containing protein
MLSRPLSEVNSSGFPRISQKSARHSRKFTETGFSLLEIIVVLAVMAIVLGFAVVGTTSSLPGYKADAAMDQVVSQLRSARMRAISQRHEVQVQFSGTNQLIITDIVLKGAAPPPVTIDFEGGAKFALVTGLPDTPMASGGGTSTTPPLSAIYFAGISNGPPLMKFTTTGAFVDNGNSFVDGTVFLAIGQKANTARAVTVLGATGRIRPYHYDGTKWQQ